MTDWVRSLLAPALCPGDLAVDLTAGNGHDTLFLCRSVGCTGRVLAFDVQRRALRQTAARLGAEGLHPVFVSDSDPRPGREPGVYLIQDCHARLAGYLPAAPSAVVANLGYLPGGDHTVMTQPDTTLAALRAALESLRCGGRLAVVVYVGHAGGEAESDGVRMLLSQLPTRQWQVLSLRAANRPQAPTLLVAEKLRSATS
jgi:predicted methyltransferase